MRVKVWNKGPHTLMHKPAAMEAVATTEPRPTKFCSQNLGRRTESFMAKQKGPLTRPILFGRQTRTTIEPVLDSLYNLLLNYNLLRSKLTDLNEIVANLIKPERVVSNDFLL